MPLPKILMLKPLPAMKFEPLKQLDYATLPIAPMGTYQNTYAPGNCTWYVASRIKVPENLGNANTWADMAVADGGHITHSPIVGAVGTTTRGSLGHVVVVTAVHGDTITIAEMNVLGYGQVDETTASASDFVYIYF